MVPLSASFLELRKAKLKELKDNGGDLTAESVVAELFAGVKNIICPRTTALDIEAETSEPFQWLRPTESVRRYCYRDAEEVKDACKTQRKWVMRTQFG